MSLQQACVTSATVPAKVGGELWQHITDSPPRSSTTTPSVGAAPKRVLKAPPYDTTAIEMSLDRLGPLEVRLVRRAEGEGLFAHLLTRVSYELWDSRSAGR